MTKRLLPILAVVLLASGAIAQSYRHLISTIKPSVVAISLQMTKGGTFDHSGTGWLCHSQNIIITARHVADNHQFATRVTFSDGSKADVVLIKLSDIDDVAMLYLNKAQVSGANRPLLKLATEAPEPGDLIAYCGFPMDYPYTARIGYVAHYVTSIGGYDEGKLRMGYPELGGGGFSGSAVVNEFGDVVGIHILRDTRLPGFNFAVPHSTLVKVFQAWGL